MRARATLANRTRCVVLCAFAFRSWKQSELFTEKTEFRQAEPREARKRTVSNFHLTSRFLFNDSRQRTEFLRSTGRKSVFPPGRTHRQGHLVPVGSFEVTMARSRTFTTPSALISARGSYFAVPR